MFLLSSRCHPSSSALGHWFLACRARVCGLSLSLRLCISLQHLAGPETFWLSLSPLTPRGPLNLFLLAKRHPRCGAEAVEGREETCGLHLPGGGAAGPSRGGRGRSPAALGCDGVAPHAVHPATVGQGRERSKAAGSSLISIPSSLAVPVGASVRKRSHGWRRLRLGRQSRRRGGCARQPSWRASAERRAEGQQESGQRFAGPTVADWSQDRANRETPR